MISYYPYQTNGKPLSYLRKDYRTLQISSLKDALQKLTTTSWSGIIWKDGRPKESNFLSADFCVLDFDDGVTTLEKASILFHNFAHIIGVTKSHQKEKNGKTCDRFRVAIPFESTIFTVSKYRWNMKKYTEKYQSDMACVDGARTFLPCTKIITVKEMGDKLPCYDAPKNKPKPLDLERYKATPVSNFVASLMRYGPGEGSRNRDCFKAALELWRKDYDETSIKRIVFNSVPTSSDFTEREKDAVIRSSRAYRDKTPGG